MQRDKNVYHILKTSYINVRGGDSNPPTKKKERKKMRYLPLPPLLYDGFIEGVDLMDMRKCHIMEMLMGSRLIIFDA